MLIETDGFMVFVETETTFGYKQINMEAEIQHKQGYQKHFKRRVNTKRAKRRNRRLWIDVDGKSGWDFYQSRFHCTYYGLGWPYYVKHIEETIQDILKNYLVDPEHHDWKYGKGAIVRWIQRIEQKFEKEAEDLLPHPSEELCRTKYRRYQDDLPPCDKSGRHDKRQYYKKQWAKKEIASYLVGDVNPIDIELDQQYYDESFDAAHERQYWEDVSNGLYDDLENWHNDYEGEFFEEDYDYEALDVEVFETQYRVMPCCGQPWLICNCPKTPKHKLELMEGYCHACHSVTCECLPIDDVLDGSLFRSGLGDE